MRAITAHTCIRCATVAAVQPIGAVRSRLLEQLVKEEEEGAVTCVPQHTSCAVCCQVAAAASPPTLRVGNMRTCPKLPSPIGRRGV